VKDEGLFRGIFFERRVSSRPSPFFLVLGFHLTRQFSTVRFPPATNAIGPDRPSHVFCSLHHPCPLIPQSLFFPTPLLRTGFLAAYYPSLLSLLRGPFFRATYSFPPQTSSPLTNRTTASASLRVSLTFHSNETDRLPPLQYVPSLFFSAHLDEGFKEPPAEGILYPLFLHKAPAPLPSHFPRGGEARSLPFDAYVGDAGFGSFFSLLREEVMAPTLLKSFFLLCDVLFFLDRRPPRLFVNNRRSSVSILFFPL